MTIDLSKVDATNKSLQGSTQVAPVTKRAHQAVVDALHAMNPAPAPTPTPTPTPAPPLPAGVSGVGLVQYATTLAKTSHLTDDVYALKVGDWDDAALLATVSGLGFLYTAAQNGDGSQWHTPDGALTVDWGNPASYVTAVHKLLEATGCKGVFLDNVGLVAGQTDLGPVTAFAQSVGPPLLAAGYKVMLNATAYTPGKIERFDGPAFSAFAKQLQGAGSHVMLEYWQQWSGGNLYQLLTGQDWQLQQPAVKGAHDAGFRAVAMTYGATPALIYGRASFILAGAAAGDVFVGHHPDDSDPFDPAWTLPNPSNVTVDYTNGTATL